MPQYLTQVGRTSAYLGAVADTSVPKTFVGPVDPHTVSGAVLRVGDKWRVCGMVAGAPVVYPPGPPGSYDPDTTTVGWSPAGQNSLTPYPLTGGTAGDIVSGVLTLLDPGITISGYSIPARVVSKAANSLVTKSWLRGGAVITSGGDVGLFDTSNVGCTDAVLQDCVLYPDNPNMYLNGVRGDNVTVQRCDIHGVVDGMDLYSSASGNPSNTQILANYIHDLAGYGPDSIGRNFSHNDCIQITDGLGIIVQGNNLSGFLDPALGQASDPSIAPNYPALNSNSVLQVTQGTGVVRGVQWTQNWCDGGGATLNLVTTGGANGNFGSITDNHFGRASYFQGGASSLNGHPGAGGDNGVTFLSVGFTFDDSSGNTYADNGHPITQRIS